MANGSQPSPEAQASPNMVRATVQARTAQSNRQSRPMNRGKSAAISRPIEMLDAPTGPTSNRSSAASDRSATAPVAPHHGPPGRTREEELEHPWKVEDHGHGRRSGSHSEDRAHTPAAPREQRAQRERAGDGHDQREDGRVDRGDQCHEKTERQGAIPGPVARQDRPNQRSNGAHPPARARCARIQGMAP